MQRLARLGSYGAAKSNNYVTTNRQVNWRSLSSQAPIEQDVRRRCTPIPNRALLSVTGPQASTFLNGQITTQIPPPDSPEWLTKGGGIYSAILGPQGRVMYDIFIYPLKIPNAMPSNQSGYIIEYDPRVSETSEGEEAKAPSLLSLLKRYILRSKVRISDVSSHLDLWSVWGSDQPDLFKRHASSWRWARSGAVEPIYQKDAVTAHDAVEGLNWLVGSSGIQDEAVWMVDRRAPGLGARVLLPKGEKPAGNEVGTSDEYTLRRILHGVPEGRDDIPPLEAFPMDSNMDMMGGVDFRKGCYVGQELTVRTYHTGVIRKRIFPVRLQSKENIPSPPLHASIVASSNQPPSDSPRPRPRGTGKLLSSIGNSALALLRLEHFEGAERGLLTLGVNAGNNNSQWSVVPKRPDWWPIQLPEEAEPQ
ncbi:ccr4 associated factor [Tulasnella sp. 419]|nr:ccr4 associated factor [Tulasnella sp. 419]